MLSAVKLQKICKGKGVNSEQLASQIERGGLRGRKAIAAVKNWQKGLLKPEPRRTDIERLAAALSVNENDIKQWKSSYKYAPISPLKARLVTQLVVGRSVQDAMDILKFTHKRAAPMVDKVLKCAIADADEQEADVDKLYVSSAWVDDAGVRIGTRRWMPKDRGRAHPIRKKASHIHVVVTEI